jgi:hypothetical protein
VGIDFGFEELTYLSQRYYALEKHVAVFPWERGERPKLYPHLSPMGYRFFASNESIVILKYHTVQIFRRSTRLLRMNVSADSATLTKKGFMVSGYLVTAAQVA